MDCRAVIVILNYNDRRVTEKLVRSVIDYTSLDRVIVVDNCSTDSSYEYLSGCFKKSEADVIRSPENGGYAKGNNYGIKYAISHYNPQYIFVANPDVAVSEKTLRNMMTALDQNSEYAVVAPIVNQGYNVWNLPGFIGMIESLFLVWFNLDKKKIKKRLMSSTNSLEEVGVVEGSFYAIRATDYNAIGGLDERTFLYAEEIILSRRLKDIGKKVGVLTAERYDHLHSASIKKAYRSSKRRAFHNFYNSFCIYNKYYLKIGPVRNAIFRVCYGLAYIERFFYDIIKH